MPRCRVCLQEKVQEEFHRNRSYTTGHATICKPCASKKTHEWRQENPLEYKAKKFKVSPEFLQELFDKYKECQICKEADRRSLSIDHDHATGKIRGLLCSKCNVALGLFRDDLYILEKAKQYLQGGRNG